MATAKKTTKTPLAKKSKSTGVAPAPAKKTLQRAPEPMYDMPMEVKDWIERANSTIKHLRGEVERMKAEIVELKAYKKWAEHRILRSDHE